MKSRFIDCSEDPIGFLAGYLISGHRPDVAFVPTAESKEYIKVNLNSKKERQGGTKLFSPRYDESAFECQRDEEYIKELYERRFERIFSGMPTAIVMLDYPDVYKGSDSLKEWLSLKFIEKEYFIRIELCDASVFSSACGKKYSMIIAQRGSFSLSGLVSPLSEHERKKRAKRAEPAGYVPDVNSFNYPAKAFRDGFNDYQTLLSEGLDPVFAGELLEKIEECAFGEKRESDVKFIATRGYMRVLSGNIVGKCACYAHPGWLTKQLYSEHECERKHCPYFVKSDDPAHYWARRDIRRSASEAKKNKRLREKEREENDRRKREETLSERFRFAENFVKGHNYPIKLYKMYESLPGSRFKYGLSYIDCGKRPGNISQYFPMCDALAVKYGGSYELRPLKDLNGKYMTLADLERSKGEKG